MCRTRFIESIRQSIHDILIPAVLGKVEELPQQRNIRLGRVRKLHDLSLQLLAVASQFGVLRGQFRVANNSLHFAQFVV